MTHSTTKPTTAKPATPRFARRLSTMALLTGFLLSSVSAPALAGPSGGRIIAGQGSIGQNGTASTINQSTDRLIIEWQNFDTNSNESVRFNQPSSSASVLNRIISGNATVFDGSLFANGNVVIVNGAGIHFGPNSRVDVGSLIASTADISNSNFLNNRLIFDRPGQPDASITNAGTITVRDTGLAALVAPGVENSGLIQAHLGTVILAAGEAHTIDFNGDGLLSFTVTKPTKAKPKRRNGKTLEALVSNKGEIRADGGTVILTAKQASRVLDNAINMSGIVRANSVGVRNGKIVLFGGNKGRVNVSGKIRARGKRRGQRGGRVHITGQKIAIPRAKIDVTGKAGGGEVLIGGAYKGGKLAGDSSIGYLQSGDLVSILTGVNAGAAGNGYIPTAEGVYVGQDATIDVSATESGNGGQAILWADGTTIFNGTIRARGGDLSGDGGFIETSGALRLGVGATASVDALAPNGRVGDWLLDPLSVTVATGGTATLAQIGDASDTTSTLTVDPSTLNNATANVSIVASDFITFSNAVSMVNAGVGLTATAGNLITVNAALSSNNGDITFNADEFAINAAVNAGTGTIQFDRVTAGALEVGLTPGTTAGVAELDTAELARLSAGSLVFGSATASANRINQLSIRRFNALATITGQTQFNALNDAGSFIFSSGDQTYNSVEYNANDGLTFAADSTITTTSGDALFNVDADGTGVVGGFDALETNTGITAIINSAANITIVAPDIRERTGTISLNANAGAGTISIQRSSLGTIGVGNGSGRFLNFSDAQLARLNAATINFGNTNLALSNTTAINVDTANLSTVGTVTLNTQATGTTTFNGANSFASVSTNGGTTTVATSASVGATGMIGFNTDTVNLGGNLTATSGITGMASTVNVQGSTGGAEIQDGVDVAATGATVNVAAGTYSRFIVNKENLTVDGAGATTIINAASPAVTIAANGVTVQDMLLQGTGIADDVGILLDGTAAPNLTGISITNVDFSNLDDGIRSQGDIGDGVATNIDVAISGTNSADPAIFEDFLDAAIDVGDTDGDAVYTVADVIVRDGDASGAATGDDGFRFGAVGDVTVNRVNISGTTGDGIQFSSAVSGDATVNISNSQIGTDANRADANGILFQNGILDTATVILGGTNQIFATGRAINVNDLQSPTTLSITGGTYDGTGGALLVDNTGVAGTDGRLNVGAAAYVGGTGSNVFEVLTDAGNAGVDIDFSGAATFDGGANGVRLSGPGIDVLNDTFGAISFGATTAHTGNIIELANGAEFLPGSPTILDATGVSFGGTLGGALTPAQLLALETQLVHFPDDPTLGLINTNNLFVVQGESIQTAVNAAGLLAGAQTVTVNAGTFGGSVEVWVNNLTLTGQGATTIIDTDAVDPFANNGDVNNGFQIAALSMTAGGPADVTGVTIQGFSFDTLTTTGTNIGIELGETAAATSTAINSTLSNNIINDQNDGIFSNLSNGTTAITGNTLTALGRRGINFADDITAGETVTITGNNVASANFALVFDNAVTNANVTISGNTITSTAMNDAVIFDAAITGSTVLIGGATAAEGNDIVGFQDGIDFSTVTGSAITIANNSRLVGGTSDGLEFEGAISGTSTIQVVGNTLIQGAENGVSFEQAVTSSAVTLDGNTTILGTASTGLSFAQTLTNATVTVSNNSLTSSGGDGIMFAGLVTTGSTVTISGNNIEGADDGVDFSGAIANGSTVNIRDNTRIEGLNTVAGDDGLGDGIAFGGAISDATTSINIADNTLIRGNDRGINFRDATTGGPATITDASVTISGNTDISGVVLDGILFNADITNANIAIGGANAAAGNSITGGDEGLDIERIRGGSFTIANNIAITGTTGDAIEFEDPITDGAMIEVSGNAAINGALAALTFEGNVTDSTVLIADNTSIAGAIEGIQTTGLSNTTFSILQNETIRGTADAGILFGGTVTNGSTVEVAGNASVRGGNDGVSFAFNIQDSSVTITGNTQITGDFFDGVNFFGDTRDSNVTIGAATVNVNTVPTAFGGNTITGGRDGIFHASGTAITGTSVVTYSNNNITGTVDGIDFDSITESAAVTVSDNTNISGLFSEGIFFAEEVENNATVTISGNTISGGDDGIEFVEEIQDDAAIRIVGNMITGNGDGIEFEEEFLNNATATISGNTINAATQEGIEINGLFGNSSMTISGNTITGISNGIVHEEEITGTAMTTISGNTISGGNGIAFNDFVNTTNTNGVQITGNTAITGTAGDGIVFGAAVTDAQVGIRSNTITGNDDGIDLAGMFAGTSSAAITGNQITGTTSEGIDIGAIGDTVAVTIDSNTISGTTGVRVGAVTTGAANGLQITGNTSITGTMQHGIHLNGPVTGTPLTFTSNTLITGADTGIKASDAITNAMVDLGGNATVTGGVNGVHFESLSGTTINTTNTNITGGTTGFKAIGSTAAGTTNRLNFANASIGGTTGAGLSVTTTSGGSGIDTNLGGGVTLTGTPSLALSGPNQTLVGDTLNDTSFNSVNGGNFVELSNGALFDPGRPTIIDGTSASFDGIQVPALSSPLLVQSIEDRLIDFDDNDTLGQIFFRPLLASDVVDIAMLINQFSQLIESGIRVSNPQTPGDWISRPDYQFDVLFGDLLAKAYPLGGCSPVLDGNGTVIKVSCLAPVQGSDISPFVADFMAELDPAGP